MSIKETSSFPAVGSRIRSMGNKAGQHTARTFSSLRRSGICTSAEAGCLIVSVIESSVHVIFLRPSLSERFQIIESTSKLCWRFCNLYK